ncbi:MAG: PaaX family transcriptional regulator C-terminal domain-containing protein [Vulcanimicrobiaceae bacterium]
MGSLVSLMAEFGLSEAAVRQAVSRMSRQGWPEAEKRGTRAYYALTPRGVKRVETISPRIYEPAAEWDGRWRLVTYTVAETKRELRDRLRKDLTLLGFAPLSASTWVSPRDVTAAMREITDAPEFEERVHVFGAEYLGPLRDRQLLERSWNLEKIAHAYREFIDYYSDRLRREREQPTLSDAQAFVERLWLVQDFRRFVYLDPGLPSALLPAHWPGSVASALFREYYAIISSRASAFFELRSALS